MIETPGYFVHQWDLRLRDLIPTSYVSEDLGETETKGKRRETKGGIKKEKGQKQGADG